MFPCFGRSSRTKLILSRTLCKLPFSLHASLMTMNCREENAKQESFSSILRRTTLHWLWARCPLQCTIPEKEYRDSCIYSDLPDAVDDLVDQFVSAETLLDSREKIDEYGWRNFGDIFADHELVRHDGAEPLISHYNNQYDLIAGFYRKYFVTGISQWKELASDLANHVVDIDIYHTDNDREEYNHGYFWHTEHFVDAGLSTHRSFSREQKAEYSMYSGGGGPGSEHCYTSGLLMHYYQTADPKFKQAVIDLAHWELVALSGAQSVLAAVNRFLVHLRKFDRTKTGKTLLSYYPLTRGTGNTICACLDAFEVTHEHTWLIAAGQIIRYSIHPSDDIAARNLDNVEIAWSYTVFLTALGKYLDVKEMHQERDADFNHACQSLLSYVSWMADHEYPYLKKPEILEFPNETWAAQELRKSVVFYYAAKYADTLAQRNLFLQRARFFLR